MDSPVLGLEEIDGSQVAVVGGKGALLGELTRIGGVRVPAGFCVTTEAFRAAVADAPGIDDLLDRLARVDVGDVGTIRSLGGDIRRTIEGVDLSDGLVAAVTRSVTRLGEHAGYAVRSSATAEDLPTASFAGQHDTTLNVLGVPAVLGEVRRCWASLFTERAVTYRTRNAIDHRTVAMAVVVQRMVDPQAAGVLVTADPVTSNRRVSYVEATYGLAEALVSGLVDPDVYKVRGGVVVDRRIAVKQVALRTAPTGGTREVAIDGADRSEPVLTDAQVIALADVGHRIEAHVGCPQDIEWCLVDGAVHIVQSRPITTLFPVPVTDDGDNHVFVSVGHAQMMTDAMKPLGISLWQLTARPRMYEAGGRLFVDVTQPLSSPVARAGLLESLGRGDPLVGDALEAVLERDGFIPSAPDGGPGPPPAGDVPAPPDTDPAVVAGLIERTQESLAALRRDIAARSGPDLVGFILSDIQELKRILFDPYSHQVFMSAMEAAWWLNEQLEAWLGEKNAADTLTRSVPDNVTSEMGLALLDVADVIRPHPEVVAFLEQVDGDDGFLDGLAALEGGREARDAIRDFLGRYGMRCVGEIDITRPRWGERPTLLVPALLANVRNFEPGAGGRRFDKGLHEAQEKELDVLERVRALPDGAQKAEETKRHIDRVRTFIGYREYPKYGMVCRYAIYKQALLAEAGRLVAAGVLAEPEDIYYLTFADLDEVVRTHRIDGQLLLERKVAFRSYRDLTPPRVLTSEGEVVVGSYRRHGLPDGALVGLPVSAGSVEGRARVILDIGEADLAVGDILVTTYTDPSWTPVFVTVAGLVTEVGGLMTHGAVIAREYGLPAVVGVQDATRLIRDGQRIRVHGSDGYVEVLS